MSQTSGDGTTSWWTGGRITIAVVTVLVLMGLSAFGGFVAGAAWSGFEEFGDAVADAGGSTGPAVDGAPLLVGETLRGTLENNVVEHPFTMEQGTTVVLELRSDDFDTVLSLRDDAGQEIASNDDISIGSDRNSRLELGLEAGSYTVVVEAFGFGSGSYELSAR